MMSWIDDTEEVQWPAAPTTWTASYGIETTHGTTEVYKFDNVELVAVDDSEFVMSRGQDSNHEGVTRFTDGPDKPDPEEDHFDDYTGTYAAPHFYRYWGDDYYYDCPWTVIEQESMSGEVGYPDSYYDYDRQMWVFHGEYFMGCGSETTYLAFSRTALTSTDSYYRGVMSVFIPDYGDPGTNETVDNIFQLADSGAGKDCLLLVRYPAVDQDGNTFRLTVETPYGGRMTVPTAWHLRFDPTDTSQGDGYTGSERWSDLSIWPRIRYSVYCSSSNAGAIRLQVAENLGVDEYGQIDPYWDADTSTDWDDGEYYHDAGCLFFVRTIGTDNCDRAKWGSKANGNNLEETVYITKPEVYYGDEDDLEQTQ